VTGAESDLVNQNCASGRADEQHAIVARKAGGVPRLTIRRHKWAIAFTTRGTIRNPIVEDLEEAAYYCA
jgi:hypothetical protein